MPAQIVTAHEVAVLNAARLVAKSIADRALGAAPWTNTADGRLAYTLGGLKTAAASIDIAIFDLLNDLHVTGDILGVEVTKAQLHVYEETAARDAALALLTEQVA